VSLWEFFDFDESELIGYKQQRNQIQIIINLNNEEMKIRNKYFFISNFVNLVFNIKILKNEYSFDNI
jgi:hypothetical protein